MSDTTGIEWTDATWNPIRGCSRVSEGCRHCYAERVAARFSGPGQPYEGLIRFGKQSRGIGATGPMKRVPLGWSGKVLLVPEHLADPLRWRRPRRVFVNSMSDLFHEDLRDEEIAVVIGVMLLAAQHTYQVLTKRPARMRDFFARVSLGDCIAAVAEFSLPSGERLPGPAQHNRPQRREWWSVERWPVPWIWLGVSVENQAAADKRLSLLVQTPAAVRFVSAEPLLSHVDMSRWLGDIDLVIAGCESGPGARAADVDWFRSLRDQCAAAGVPFFLKQAEESLDHGDDGDDVNPDGTIEEPIAFGDGSRWKKRRPGGRHIIGLPYLDGVQHAAMPGVTP